MAIKDMVLYLNTHSDGVAIFDATNHTQVRRADLVEKVRKLNSSVIVHYCI
jgi:6-phosphofructo-2-kinase